MSDSPLNTIHLTEKIPDELLQEWRAGPLRFAKSLPEVMLDGNLITLRWGREIVRARIEDCNFRVGRPWQMKFNSRSARPLFPFGSFDLILIDFPPLCRSLFGKVHSYTTAPVGYTKESLSEWNRALGDVLGTGEFDETEDVPEKPPGEPE